MKTSILSRICNPTGMRRLAEERAWLAEVLADLLDMGVPVLEAVSRLGADAMRRRTAPMRTALAGLERALRRGSTLSYAVQQCEVFPVRWGLLIRQGEDTCNLPRALRSIAALESREPCLPYESVLWAVLCLASVTGIGCFLAAFVLPTFAALHAGLGITLPLSSRLLLSLVRPCQLPLLLAQCAVVVVGLAVFYPSRAAALTVRWVDRLGGREPALRDQAVAASAIAAGLRLGIPVPQAVEVAARSVTLARYRDALGDVATDGSTSLSEALAGRARFDPELVAVCRLAESGEALADGLAMVSERLLERAEAVAVRTRQTGAALLSLGVGIAVALLATGVFESMVGLIGKSLEAVLP